MVSSILPKNNQKRLWYLRLTCFCSVFGRNWRHQKDILKINDLYQSSKVKTFRSFFGRIEDTKKTFWNQLTFIKVKKNNISKIQNCNSFLKYIRGPNVYFRGLLAKISQLLLWRITIINNIHQSSFSRWALRLHNAKKKDILCKAMYFVDGISWQNVLFKVTSVLWSAGLCGLLLSKSPYLACN